MKRTVVFSIAIGLILLSQTFHAQETAGSRQDGGEVTLVPTDHPRVPNDLSQLWLAPDWTRSARTPALAEFTEGVKLEVDANYSRALPVFSKPALQEGVLGAYALYYEGLAELRLGRPADARRTFQALESKQPVGYLAEAAALREAECAETTGDQRGALAIYIRLSKTRTMSPDEVLMRVARLAKAVGDTEEASNAYARVYFEFPLSDLSTLAGSELDSLPNVQRIAPDTNRYRLELGRAERLFGARRYAQARTAFEGVRAAASGDEREIVNLRLAECDYFLKRPRNARDGVRPYIEHASRQAEALFFYAVATRELGDTSEYLQTVSRLATDFPTQSWTEEGLNNLATYHIQQSDDEQADTTFRMLYEKFPTGRYAERAAWKIGWWSYKGGRYADTARVFERAAADFPRSDYRPPWLYWSGRAHDMLNERALAQARFRLAATDYLNSYYGRLASARLDGAVPQQRLVVDIRAAGPSGPIPTIPVSLAGPVSRASPVTPGTIVHPDEGGYDGAPMLVSLPANESVVRALLGLELYDQAIDELHYAQKVWGDSPPVMATLGWIAHMRGDLRGGINAIKRAYPQYLAAGGEQLPAELLKVLFPVDYWPLIQRYSNERQLDPYTVAALIAQESTFAADVRSPANAYGLMQLLPSTARRYAKTLHLNRFSINLLTTAETNIRMGTAYFSDLVKQFGGLHFALAGYNAGENRVSRWISERPDFGREEFIDDIPFPETQNYVKKILGTADDYRRLYGMDSRRAGDYTDPEPRIRTTAAHDPSPVRRVATMPRRKGSSASSAAVHKAGSRAKPAVTRKAALHATRHKTRKTV